MQDYFKGTVEQVIDEETLLIDIAFVGDTNSKEYDDTVTIHISKLEPPFLKNIPKEKCKERLKKKLVGITVYCYLLGKTKDGKLNAKVVCDGPEYRGKRKRV